MNINYNFHFHSEIEFFWEGEIESRTKVVARETCMISINNRCVRTFTNFFDSHVSVRVGGMKKGAHHYA